MKLPLITRLHPLTDPFFFRMFKLRLEYKTHIEEKYVVLIGPPWDNDIKAWFSWKCRYVLYTERV